MQQEDVTYSIGELVRNRYKVEAVLGGGGFDLVYLVSDQWANQERFILRERIAEHKQELDHFLFDAVILKQLDHPALPRVYRVFGDEKRRRACMVTQYIPGTDLESLRLQRPHKRFPLPLLLSLMAPVLAAVSYLHKQHPPLLHRNIVPANIIVTAQHEAYLVNYGLYKPVQLGGGTLSTQEPFVPGYTAPECYTGEFSPMSDQYALAAVLYIALTGLSPPDARDREARIANMDVDPLVKANQVTLVVPTVIAETIHRAMSLKSDDRFPSVEEFWLALNATVVPEMSPSLVFLPMTTTPLPAVSEDESSALPQLHVQAKESILSKLAHVLPQLKRPGGGKLLRTRPARLTFLHWLPALPLKPLPMPLKIPRHMFGRRRSVDLLLLFAFVLLVSIVSSTLLWVFAANQHGASSSLPVIATTSASPTAAPHSSLASTYKGTIHSIPTNVTAAISLTHLQQDQEIISGDVMLGPGMAASGMFTGRINVGSHLEFTMEDTSGEMLYYFEGGLHSDGNIAGSYCRLNQQGKCTNEYGLWSISPLPPR